MAGSLQFIYCRVVANSFDFNYRWDAGDTEDAHTTELDFKRGE